jgi:HlyD family secretion protein
MKRNTWIGLGIGAVVVAGGSWWALRKPAEEIKWRSAKVERGGITQRINATGSVSPVVQVAVGTQVSGVISALYVDYNSIVKKGQLIAQIDPTIWETQLKDAEAGLERARTTMDDARRQYERAKRLAADKLLSDQDLEAKQVTYQTSVTTLENAQASLARAKANLGYCNITAPVDGVVISRLADVGQTVAASFSTPNLFQIAQDLSKMKVQVSIGESDIDEVKVGQRAFFTVDSLPDRQFGATVSLVRQEPITTQNVVNYVVEMIVPNEALPGNEEEGKTAPGRSQGGEGGKAAGQGEAAPDPEKAWERMKDRLPTGTTKAEFLKRFKERQAERAKAMTAAASANSPAAGDRNMLARIPGGASQLGGPKFTGSLALRSGMTANVTIVTNQRKDVLRVPNAALRFNPSAFIKEEKKAEGPRLGQPMTMGGGPPRGAQTGTGSRGGLVAKREDKVWVLENGKPKAIVVKAGITDGQYTELLGDGVPEGQTILIGVENTKQASGAPQTGATPGGQGGRR